MKAAFAIRSAPRRGTPLAWGSAGSLCFLLGGVTLGIALAAPAAAQAPAPAQAARYPLDPVCPWGRLADGHGLMVRCLERGEAQALLAAATPNPYGSVAPNPPVPNTVPAPHAAAPAPVPYGAASVPPPYGSAPVPAPYAGAPRPAAPATAFPPAPAMPGVPGAAVPPAAVPPAAVPPAAVPPGAVPPGAVAPRPGAPAAAGAAPGAVPPPLVAAVPAPAPGVAAQPPPTTTPPRSTKLYRRVSVREVGAAVADTGELPEAQVQLRKVQDRYAQCVIGNGGMEGEQGRVTVRFLVRERGRAEGVAVKDRQGVSLAAAKCVAEVVDRRFVGYPAAPIVGATLSIEFVPEGAAR